MRRQGWSAGALAVVVSLAFAGSAPAAVQVGQTFVPDLETGGGGGGGASSTVLQVASPGSQYAAPSAGVLTSWSFQSGATPPSFLRLKVARAASPLVPGPGGGTPDNQVFTIVGDSAMENPGPGLNTYPTSIPVQQGDVIGFYTPPVGHVATSPSDFAYRVGAISPPSDPPPGSTQNVFIGPPGSPPVQLDVSAQLEPDCDRDGFGDETQDDNIRSCPPGPSVSFSKEPKDKLKAKKKKVKVTYEFTASEPDSTFTCALDDKQEACTSPYKAKVKKGKHDFSVTATDAGGNAGTPSTDSFKVKAKK